MSEKSKQIRADLERTVAHLARVHGVGQAEIWKEMYLKSLEQL